MRTTRVQPGGSLSIIWAMQCAEMVNGRMWALWATKFVMFLLCPCRMLLGRSGRVEQQELQQQLEPQTHVPAPSEWQRDTRTVQQSTRALIHVLAHPSQTCIRHIAGCIQLQHVQLLPLVMSVATNSLNHVRQACIPVYTISARPAEYSRRIP